MGRILGPGEAPLSSVLPFSKTSPHGPGLLLNQAVPLGMDLGEGGGLGRAGLGGTDLKPGAGRPSGTGRAPRPGQEALARVCRFSASWGPHHRLKPRILASVWRDSITPVRE